MGRLRPNIMHSIAVSFSFEAFHNWPDAPEDVSFLRNTHRHLFYGKAYIEVFHDNREVEFFMLKREIDDYIKLNFTGNIKSASCEKIASNLFWFIRSTLELPALRVEIWEDNENGAIIEERNL